MSVAASVGYDARRFVRHGLGQGVIDRDRLERDIAAKRRGVRQPSAVDAQPTSRYT